MKILFIAPRYTGGIGGHAAMLADQLQKHGYEVTKMQVPHIPIKNLKNPSFAIFGTLKGIMTQKKFDIVHGFNVPSVFAMKYAHGKKKVLSIHGMFSEQVKALHSNTLGSIVSSTEEKVLHWADKLTTDSKLTQKIYKEKLNFYFEYLPSAIDTSKLKQIPEVEKESKQVIYLGRDSYEKGIDILKKVEQKINAKIIYCTDLSWHEAMINLKKSTILIVPSRMESLPTSIKEAFYFKVPVIATNVGGIPELMKNNHTGILIPPEEPEILVKNVNELLNNTEKQKELANNAYDFVMNNMVWQKIISKYITFYENLLKS